jgi:hypothetical protein
MLHTGRAAAAAVVAASSAADILKDPGWPADFPFGAAELGRYDEAPDTAFYATPRFVTHIDDAAIGALTKYYATAFPESGRKDTALLDICSSWISHYPKARAGCARRALLQTRSCYACARACWRADSAAAAVRARRGTARGASAGWA